MNNITLQNGNCLELMKHIPDRSIDMILCDLPYGVLNKGTQHSRESDKVIDFVRLWHQYSRIIKENGAIVLFGSGMFTSDLMQSGRKLWRYNLVWDKVLKSGFLNANRMPLRQHEDILVFYKKLPVYHPQMTKCEPGKRNHSRGDLSHCLTNKCYGSRREMPTVISDEKFPVSILSFSRSHKNDEIHPNQKPVPLLSWLINTYTNPGDTVLDNCMGSGSTGVACIETGRKFIGMEINETYFHLAEKRINEEINKIEL